MPAASLQNYQSSGMSKSLFSSRFSVTFSAFPILLYFLIFHLSEQKKDVLFANLDLLQISSPTRDIVPGILHTALSLCSVALPLHRQISHRCQDRSSLPETRCSPGISRFLFDKRHETRFYYLFSFFVFLKIPHRFRLYDEDDSIFLPDSLFSGTHSFYMFRSISLKPPPLSDFRSRTGTSSRPRHDDPCDWWDTKQSAFQIVCLQYLFYFFRFHHGADSHSSATAFDFSTFQIS